ncbi:anti-repressor SinI family protein [Virgibacillus sp. C22-A2]|uniref:Anti-repressor SinI family protein n=1 Tax=Virgibacillus tibetensis TaxID=3042313 RepID=A0ABU6KC35_9BACI|nr:anti-repressor SinI family protein [Virgibacillus sp. C22-A2]
MENTVEQTALDYEWINLLKEAKHLGLTVEEIRLYLLEAGQSA